MQVEASRGKQFCQGFLYSSSDNPLDNRYYKATAVEIVIAVASGILSAENPIYSSGLIFNVIPLAEKIRAISPDITGWKRIGKGAFIFLGSTVISVASFTFSGLLAEWHKKSQS